MMMMMIINIIIILLFNFIFLLLLLYYMLLYYGRMLLATLAVRMHAVDVTSINRNNAQEPTIEILLLRLQDF